MVDTTRLSLEDFAKNLTLQLDRPVIDNTGLTGLYDSRLEFSPAAATSGLLLRESGDSHGRPCPDARFRVSRTSPSVLNAIQE